MGTVFRSAIGALAVALLAGSAACGEGERVVRPESAGSGAALRATVPAHAPASSSPHGAPAPGGITWRRPEGWTERTPASPMRRAQYRLAAAQGDPEDGECAVFYFGAGRGGDVPANVARWASQFRGPGGVPVDPRVSEVRVGELTVTRVEVKGSYTPSPMTLGGGPAPPARPGYLLLGAIVPRPRSSWFFKCAGPEATMAANRERFDELIASIAPAP